MSGHALHKFANGRRTSGGHLLESIMKVMSEEFKLYFPPRMKSQGKMNTLFCVLALPPVQKAVLSS